MHAATVNALNKVQDGAIFRDWEPTISMMTSSDGSVVALANEVPVSVGETVTLVAIPGIEALFTGRAAAPDLSRDIEGDYLSLLLIIERTAVFFCNAVGIVGDQEFQRLYRQLRRRPDGTDPNPLFSYLRAAARLFMAHRDTSRAEYEAVASRLERSARHFSDGLSSTNYLRHVSGFIA